MIRQLDWAAIYEESRGRIEPARWYTAAEVAVMLGVKGHCVNARCLNGSITARMVKLGGASRRWEIRGRDLLRFLREQALFAPRPRAA